MREAEEQKSTRSDGRGTETTRSYDGPALEPGGQIGPFRIERELGRGAMGVVYLAHDTKLNRPVAIKSLPGELLENHKARTLFTREARVLASLNHPNIATLYEELQEAEGIAYLVLEYIPGQTLAEHTARAKPEAQEALLMAQQIAEALAAAHEHQVIHRDLKPGNIKITPEGRIKVLDFGLAKALGGPTGDLQSTVTEPGRIMGTPTYMSPEQARGQEVDERCDIWAFGCLLYEMLTGKVPFKGGTVSDTLAAVLEHEPDWQALPPTTPANIQVLLRRCLEKDRRRRLHDIVDAALEINETLSGALETLAPPGKPAPASRLFRRDVMLGAVLCSVVAVLIAGSVFRHLVRPDPPVPPVVMRLPINVPADKPLYSGIAPNHFVAISPDGMHLVYVGKLDNGDPQLYLRSMDELQIKPIPGTRNAHNPFFSPDGQWLGFFTDRQLKKVSLAGGEPTTLLEDIPMGVVAFGNWAHDETIVFSVRSGQRGLHRIPDRRGQQAEILAAPVSEDNRVYYCYPQVLPGGQAILYTHISQTSRIEAFLTETGTQQLVLDDASYATYVSSGHLVFVRDQALMAVPFDVEQLKPTGEEVHLINDDVGFDWTGKTPQIAVSANGTAAYISGAELHNGERKGEFVWVDRHGKFTALGAAADVYEGPRLSPDDQLIAVGIRSKKEGNSQKKGDIHVNIYNTQLGTFTPLTTEGESRYPQWSPDKTRIAFWGWTQAAERGAVFSKIVGASAPAARLASKPATAAFLHPYAWSKNLLTCTVLDPKTQEDIWIVDLDGEEEPQPFLRTEHREYNPILSPDGRWLAYVSDESGQPVIYLREYPGEGQRWPVPTPGATNPVWSRDGRELYYLSGSSMMAVQVSSERNFPVGKPERLFESSDLIVSGGRLARNYDVSSDERFLMVRWSDNAKGQLICVHNWFEELKRRTPAPRNE